MRADLVFKAVAAFGMSVLFYGLAAAGDVTNEHGQMVMGVFVGTLALLASAALASAAVRKG